MKKIIFVLLACVLLLQFSSCKANINDDVSSSVLASFEPTRVSSTVSSVLESSEPVAVSSQTSSREGKVSSSFEVSKNESKITSSQDNYDQNDESQAVGVHITSEMLKAVTSQMTYKEIFALLGNPERFFFATQVLYIVDNTKFLILDYESEDEVCQLSGDELLRECVDFSSFYYSSKEAVADTVVIDGYELPDDKLTYTILSTNYKSFRFAKITLPKSEYENLKLKTGDVIRIKYKFPIPEINPPRIKVLDVKIIEQK